VKQLDQHLPDLPPEAIQSIKAPTLIIIGDSDIVRPEHSSFLACVAERGRPS
jgi:pimeloyl-ACP methyl ester carboxylesterase